PSAGVVVASEVSAGHHQNECGVSCAIVDSSIDLVSLEKKRASAIEEGKMSVSEVMSKIL
ncbi:hypothetical protein Tco_1034760, partial [Tanacetum coccineum]